MARGLTPLAPRGDMAWGLTPGDINGAQALEDLVKADDAAYHNMIALVIPVMSEGIILLAKEIDALKALVEARDNDANAG